MDNKRIVVTGVGPLASVGIGKDDFWKGLVEKRINIKLKEFFLDGVLWGKFPLHTIDNFDINNFIEKKLLEDIKAWKEGDEILDLYYLMAAAKLALEDSNLKYDADDNDVGCIVTHENPGLEQYFSKFIDVSFDIFKNSDIDISKKCFSEVLYNRLFKSSYDLQTFMILFHVLKVFKLHGYSLFLNNACASGLYGLEVASQIIRQGRCQAVVVVAADSPGIYKYLWFEKLNMYAKDGLIKPFSSDSTGLAFGEGGAGMVIEDFEHAVSRGAKIYGEYVGGGFSQEAWKVTFPEISGFFYKKAIEEAIRNSKIEIGDVDLINAHGVGNHVIDRYEAKVINSIFGETGGPLVTAFKPYFGHNLGGSTLLELVALLLCIDNDLALPVLNIGEAGANISNVNIVKQKIKTKLNVALKICCAFAGYNGAAIFRKI